MTTALGLDSSTLLTWILQEPQWQVVETILSTPDTDVVLPSVGLVEVVETARRKGNVSTGEMIAQLIASRGVRVVAPERDMLLRAAELLELSKQNPGPVNRHGVAATLSLGDSMIIATAEGLRCQVVSRDSYWDQLAADGHITVKVVTF